MAGGGEQIDERAIMQEVRTYVRCIAVNSQSVLGSALGGPSPPPARQLANASHPVTCGRCDVQVTQAAMGSYIEALAEVRLHVDCTRQVFSVFWEGPVIGAGRWRSGEAVRVFPRVAR
jgi:hypothetical protein